jgi:hypothetical protein
MNLPLVCIIIQSSQSYVRWRLLERILHIDCPANPQTSAKLIEVLRAMKSPKLPGAIRATEALDYSVASRVAIDKDRTVINDVIDDYPNAFCSIFVVSFSTHFAAGDEWKTAFSGIKACKRPPVGGHILDLFV